MYYSSPPSPNSDEAWEVVLMIEERIQDLAQKMEEFMEMVKAFGVMIRSTDLTIFLSELRGPTDPLCTPFPSYRAKSVFRPTARYPPNSPPLLH